MSLRKPINRMTRLQSALAGFVALITLTGVMAFISKDGSLVPISKGARIMLIGNNLGSRMMNADHFETALHLRYPDSMLYVRNMCDGGNTAGFRPHSGRNTPWAFPGAEKFQTELAKPAGLEGFVEYPDQWLTKHQADIIIGFFGYNESFEGPAGLENFKGELEAFIKHSLAQQYNGSKPPRLVLVSPIAFEDLSSKYDLPDGKPDVSGCRAQHDQLEGGGGRFRPAEHRSRMRA